MEELLNMLEAMAHDDKVHVEVHKMNRNDFKKQESKHDEDEMAKIAHLNRMLYEAHISAGFTSEEALAMTIAAMNN